MEFGGTMNVGQNLLMRPNGSLASAHSQPGRHKQKSTQLKAAISKYPEDVAKHAQREERAIRTAVAAPRLSSGIGQDSQRQRESRYNGAA
jgi:hypothetical protein